MTRRLALALAATALAVAVTPAHADDYAGECRMTTVLIEAATGQSHVGEIDVEIVAVDPTAAVEVRCELSINGIDQGTVLTAEGIGVAANAGRFEYSAEPGSIMTLCTVVSINGAAATRCKDEEAPATTVVSPVVGYVTVSGTASGPPSFMLWGALADPLQWSCSDNAPATPYAVTCVPLPDTVLTWRCDVLHADVSTASIAAVARTSLDCDGTGPAEAQTDVVTGTGGHHSRWAPSSVLVTTFTCTVDNGLGGAALPEFVAGCGDPGVPTVG